MTLTAGATGMSAGSNVSGSTEPTRAEVPATSPPERVGVAVRDLSHWFIPPKGVAPALVLDGINLDVPHGQFVSLIGSSGCGKTTLLNLIAGIDSPRLGSIETRSAEGERIRARDGRLGFMFARDALFPWRTLLRNVEYGLEARRVARKERRARAMEAIELVGLAGSEHKFPAELSQGMRQRANLARLLTADPDFFLMDEPFSALDAETKAIMQQEFLRIWEPQPRTVVFVTHDINEAALLSDRVLIMAKGRIVHDMAVPFPRPRDLDELRFDNTFVDFVHGLRDEFSQWSTTITRNGSA